MNKLLEFGRKALFYVRVLSGYEEQSIRSFRLQLEKRRQQLKYDGKSIALLFNLDIYRWAAGTREVLSNAKLPNGVSFYSIYGTSFHTPLDVCYGSETSPIEDLS